MEAPVTRSEGTLHSGPDQLVHHAVALLEDGRIAEAQTALVDALALDPLHLHAGYHHTLLAWRAGTIADDEMLTRLGYRAKVHGARWEARFFLALAHAERGDIDAATAAASEAKRMVRPGSDEHRLIEAGLGAWPAVAAPPRSIDARTSDRAPIALTADGRLVVSTRPDSALGVWELASGRLIAKMDRQRQSFEPVTRIAVAPDGRRVLSLSPPCLDIWDLLTGQHLHTVSGFGTSPLVPIAGADGRLRRLLKISWSEVEVIALPSAERIERLQGHRGKIEDLAAPPDGRMAVSAGSDGTLRVWDVSGKRCLHVLRGHESRVLAVAVSDDARVVVSAGEDQTIRVWAPAEGRCLHVLRGHHSTVISVALTGGGEHALSCSQDDTIRLWQTKEGRCLRTFVARRSRAIAIARNCAFAVSTSDDDRIRVWEIPSPIAAPFLRPAMPPVDARTAAAAQLTADLRRARLALEGEDAYDALDALESARRIEGYERHPDSLALWEDLRRRTRRGYLRGAWPLHTLRGHVDMVSDVALRADGRMAVSVGDDATLRVWRTTDGQCMRVLRGHDKRIHGVAITPDGRLAITTGEDKTLRVWDLGTGDCLRVMRGRHRAATTVAVTPDGRLALSAADEWLRLWDILTGTDLWGRTRRSPWSNDRGGAIMDAVGFTPDGTVALARTREEAVAYATTTGGECLKEYPADSFDLTRPPRLSTRSSARYRFDVAWALGSAEVTLDARIAAVPRRSGVEIWDTELGAVITTLAYHANDVIAAALSADGSLALSGGADGCVVVWHLDWGISPCGSASWDEGARPLLEAFLSRHSTQALGPWKRRVTPRWEEEDVRHLLRELTWAGYGWLRPEGVRAELKRAAMDWRGPSWLSS